MAAIVEIAARDIMRTIQDELSLQLVRQEKFRKEISDANGSSAPYLSKLKLSDISSADDPRLEDFYELYSAVFTLEEEREPIEGFRTVLELNNDARVLADFSPLREQITIATDSAGKVVGAANYILYGYRDNVRTKYGIGASSQLNFLCVDQNYRGAGIGGYLLDDLYKKVGLFAVELGQKGPFHGFVTCEQNNPSRMTQEQLDEDMAAALIDPYERMRWWRARGFAKLGFEYCQPALNAGQEPCRYIDFFARFVGSPPSNPRSLPAPVVLDHLRRFFFVSVGKFEQDMDAEPNWLRQRDALAAMDEVDLV